MQAAFPGLKVEKEEVPEEEETTILYLWEGNKDAFEIYKLLRFYLNEYNGIDTAILLKLVESKGLPLEDILEKIPYLHSGYVEVITSKQETPNG